MKLLLKEKVNEALAAVAPITLIVLCISVALAPMQAGAMLLFLTGAVINAIPGIIMQLALIPVLVVTMDKAGLMVNDR